MTILLVNNLLNKSFSYLFDGFAFDGIVSVDGVNGQLPESVRGFDAVILSGSEESILNDRDWMDRQMEFVKELAEREIPVLGVCFGHQIIARALFGREAVRKAREPEIGWFEVEVVEQDPLFDGIPGKFYTFHSHFDEVVPVSDRINILARSEICPVQAMRIKGLPMWGVQFHPEIGAQVGVGHLEEIKPLFPHLVPLLDKAVEDVKDSGISAQLFENFGKLIRG